MLVSTSQSSVVIPIDCLPSQCLWRQRGDVVSPLGELFELRQELLERGARWLQPGHLRLDDRSEIALGGKALHLRLRADAGLHIRCQFQGNRHGGSSFETMIACGAAGVQASGLGRETCCRESGAKGFTASRHELNPHSGLQRYRAERGAPVQKSPAVGRKDGLMRWNVSPRVAGVVALSLCLGAASRGGGAGAAPAADKLLAPKLIEMAGSSPNEPQFREALVT